ncbi:MAG TPA: HEAT repeat domain-containing protein [Polyangia bacterium]|jgi:HEAT repeat protein|nr:HEAT repeat domain-containing protein [Polyangia bacterium]
MRYDGRRLQKTAGSRPAPAASALQSFFLHVSHHQFEVEDAEHQFQSYTFEASENGIETLAYGAVVHLRRAACEIPIVVEVRSDPPPDPAWQFHLVSEGSFECPTGKLAVASPESSGPILVPVPRGALRIQVRQAELDTSEYDGGFGADHYRVVVWPGAACETRLLSSVKISGDDVLRPKLRLGDVAALLRSKDPTDRCHAAVESLRHLRAGDAKAFALLARAAKDASPAVRACVASALGVAGDQQVENVLPLLDGLASDKSENVRRRVPEAFAQLGGRAGASRMVRAIAGKDATLATQAASLLWIVLDDLDVRDLVPILQSKTAERRLAALKAIRKIGGSGDWAALAPLSGAVGALLKDKNLEVRKRAAEVVEKLGAPLDALLKLARSPTNKIRESAARSVGESKNVAAYDALVRLLADRHVGVQREAAVALGCIGDKRAVPLLAKKLEDGTYNLNWYAARGLAGLGGSRAVAALFRYARRADADEKFDYIGREATERLGAMLDAAATGEEVDGASGDIDVGGARKLARAMAASSDERLSERGRALLEHLQ